MLPYIILAIVGIIVLVIGIYLIVRRNNKPVGIVLTVVGIIVSFGGIFLSVCTFILVDFIRTQPVKEPPADVLAQLTEASAVTEPGETDDIDGNYLLGEDSGGDWRTWRSYSDDYSITDDLTVCLSLFDDVTGYAVYDSANGLRIASLIKNTDADIDPWKITAEDKDGDGINELGISLTNGETLWFAYRSGETWSENNTAGCFEMLTVR